MKKTTLLSIVSAVLGALVFLTCLLPAISYKTTLAGQSKTNTVTFYKMFDADFGMGIAIVVLLAVGAAVAAVAAVAVDFVKANKKIGLLANACAALLLVVAGVLFFFITNGYEVNASLGALASVETSLGIGAIISAILAIAGGAVAGYNAFLALKK